MSYLMSISNIHCDASTSTHEPPHRVLASSSDTSRLSSALSYITSCYHSSLDIS